MLHSRRQHVTKLKKLLSWLPSRCQDWTKGNPANSSMVSLEKVPIIWVFWVSLVVVSLGLYLSVCLHDMGCRNRWSPIRENREGGSLTQPVLLADLNFTTVDAVANPTAFCMAGSQWLYFCLLGRSRKIIFYYCLPFWLSASPWSSCNLSLLFFIV